MSQQQSQAQAQTVSRMTSPIPYVQPQRNVWHRYPHLTGAAIGALTAAPTALLIQRFRKPIGRFINYLGRVGSNMASAAFNTPYTVKTVENEEQHKNTINAKDF